MMRYVLDTDHVSLILRGDIRLETRVAKESGVCTTVITFQESFNGWMARINQAKPGDDFVALYTKLSRSINYFKEAKILNFDEAANLTFKTLLKQYPQLRKVRLERDLRIAAIALSHDVIVVTRNHKDFSLVPGLKIVDWTI
jgi:tRNA(fMet)-specific endonuclease VapC